MAAAQAFGRVLRRLRIEKGLTQENLGLEAAVQRNFISLIELGRNQPTITTIFKLAKALGCRPADFIEQVEKEVRAIENAPIRRRRITLRE